jgi:hypothetical protein
MNGAVVENAEVKTTTSYYVVALSSIYGAVGANICTKVVKSGSVIIVASLMPVIMSLPLPVSMVPAFS